MSDVVEFEFPVSRVIVPRPKSCSLSLSLMSAKMLRGALNELMSIHSKARHILQFSDREEDECLFSDYCVIDSELEPILQALIGKIELMEGK